MIQAGKGSSHSQPGLPICGWEHQSEINNELGVKGRLVLGTDSDTCQKIRNIASCSPAIYIGLFKGHGTLEDLMLFGITYCRCD